MASEDFTIDIDLDHIEKGVKNLDKLLDAIEDSMYEAKKELMKQLENKLREKLQLYGLGSSALASSIIVTDLGDGVQIELSAKYAMYVEFGTGLIGEENPHPDPSFDSNFEGYDLNGWGEDGWDYYINGRKYHTLGQESHPAMYETYKWAKYNATKVYRKYLREEIKKVTD